MTDLIPALKHKLAYRANLSKLRYYNPHSYGKAELSVDEELKGIETAINKCVGYETTPIQMTHENHFHQEPTKFNALGIKYRGDLMYRALVTWSMEENMLGTDTLRYWVISPFIDKKRANSNNPYPNGLTEYGAIRTNDLKKVVSEVLSYPAITFDTVMAYHYKRMEDMSHTVLKTDEAALDKEVDCFWSDVRREDNKTLLMEWFAHALNGNMKGCIPSRESLVERAKKHLETIEPLHEQIDEANSLTPVFVSQFGDGDVARCYTVKPEGGVTDKYIEPEGSVRAAYKYIEPEGFVDKLVVHEAAGAMPFAIKSKLATLQINETNMESGGWGEYKYIPNVGALIQNTFFDTGGRHGMVLLNPSELIEVFPDV